MLFRSLEKYFGNKLNRKLAVPDLSARGFAPQGGRLLIIGGKPAAQFLYTSATGDLVALVIAHSDAPYLPAQSDRRGDVNIVHWRNNGYAYAFAGTIDHQKLADIADRSHLPYHFVDQPGMVAIETRDGVKSPIEVSAEILATLRYRAEDTFNADLFGAVIRSEEPHV